MKKKYLFIGTIIILLFIFGFTISSRKNNSLKFVLFGNKIPLPQNTGIQPPECQVKSITKIGSGTRPDFSADGRLIAYDKKVGKSYELFIIDADGSNSRCLTCNQIPSEIQGKHKGKATFHPSGQYLLFSSENESGDHRLTTIPGIGDNHDFWVRSLKSNTYWRLTHLPINYALQYPRFSANGQKLLWSERYQKEKGAIWKRGHEYGLWKMKLADFLITENGPQLANIIELKPGGDGFYEPHGFSPDGQKIIFTAAFEPEKSQFYGDIYTYDLASQELVNLTQSDHIHDEQALFSPNGQKISLMSGPFVGLLRIAYQTDLYLIDADGGNRLRLTHFNDLNHPDYAGSKVIIDKNAWSPDGAQIVSAYTAGTALNAKEPIIFKITFTGPCGSQPR